MKINLDAALRGCAGLFILLVAIHMFLWPWVGIPSDRTFKADVYLFFILILIFVMDIHKKICKD